MSDTGADEGSTDETLVLDPEQDEEVLLGPPSAEEALRYFGVDFDVEGLVRRFERDELIIPRFDPEDPQNKGTGYAGFQRDFVWKKRQMDRFIESILLGYPVPGIFLVELKSRQYLVLDGQQRLTTLSQFFKGEVSPGREFALEYVAEPFQGRSYETLDAPDKRVLNNALIQATVTLPVGEAGKLAIYTLFERINSGGTQLKEQQIRVAVFPGDATQMIRKMNSDENWRKLFGPRHRDLRDQEMILRYLALKDVGMAIREKGPEEGVKDFQPPMSTFMSRYLNRNETMTDARVAEEIQEFSESCRLLVESVGGGALKRNNTINAARADSILVGLALAVRDNQSIAASQVTAATTQLENDEEYLGSTQKSTSHRASVRVRISKSIDAFAGH